MRKIRIFEKVKRENVGSKLQQEIIEYGNKGKYKDPLISGGYHDFWSNYSRTEVCLTDPIGEKLTMGFMKMILMKYFKFTPNDEVQTEYIMEDIRAAVQILNLKEPLIQIGFNSIMSGWALVLWQIQKNEALEYALTAKILGWDHCHPRFWRRFLHPSRVNKISHYRAVYVPYPTGRESAHYGMKMERFTFHPRTPGFQHLARGGWNYGLGYSRIQPIWDAVTKLRERSDSEHFRSSNFLMARYPPSWKAKGKAKKFLEKVRRSDRRHGLAVEEYINPKSGDPTGLPSVTYRPWSQGADGQQFDTNKTTFLDNEWARLLCNLDYSQVWAVGAQAGQQEGSEINLTRDDRADIAEFSLIAPLIKKVLKYLAELGIFSMIPNVSKESIQLLLSEQYQIVCWKTWEYNDKMTIQAEQLEHQMEMDRGSDEDRNSYDQSGAKAKENIAFMKMLEMDIIAALKNNTNVPMTPIMSSWGEKAGVYKGHLLIKYHDEEDIFGYSYGGRPEDDEAYHKYLDMMDSGSKGGWIWDNILVRGGWIGKPFTKGSKIQHQEPPGRPARFEYTPVPEYGDIAGSAAAMKKFKMEGEKATGTPGLGTSTDPFYVPPQKPQKPKKTKEVDAWDVWQTKPGEPISAKPETKHPTQYYEMPQKYYNPTKIKVQALPPLTELSRKKFNRFSVKTINHSFGNTTIDLIKKLIERAENFRNNNQIRYNSISIGNPMAFDIPLYYEIDGKISEEYPCPEDWKKIENHQGNLWLYADLGHVGEKITVGTYDYLGWDMEKDLPLAKFNYDEKLIREFIKNSGKYDESEIIRRLDAGLEPEMSTEYYCKTVENDGKIWQKDFRDSMGRPRFEGIAIVEIGNCYTGKCDFERIENSKIKRQKIKKIVRQSSFYYMYLENGAKIMFTRYGDKFHAVPARGTGPMETITAKSIPDAIRKYKKKHNLVE